MQERHLRQEGQRAGEDLLALVQVEGCETWEQLQGTWLGKGRGCKLLQASRPPPLELLGRYCSVCAVCGLQLLVQLLWMM